MWLATMVFVGIVLSKFAAPLANGLLRHDTTCTQEFFHISVTEAEAVVERDDMADYLSGKAITFVGIECGRKRQSHFIE